MENEYLEEETPTGTRETGYSEEKHEDADKAKRHAEIIAGKEKQAKEAERRRLVAETAIDVMSDNSMLLEMDPEIGKEVVKYLHKKGQATTDDYESIVSGLKGGKKDEPDIEKIVEERFRKKEEELNARETRKKVDDWLSKAPSDRREEMEAEYLELADGRNLTPERAAKIMDKIDAFYRKKELEEERKDLAYASMAATGYRKSGDLPKASAKKLAGLRALGYSDHDLKELGYL